MTDIDFEADSRSGQIDLAAPDDDQTKSLADLAAEAVLLEQRIANGNALLEQLSAKLRDLLEQKIPSKLQELGVQSLKLEDGSVLEAKEIVRASLPSDPDRQRQALEWLREHNHADLIKNVVQASFGKGEDELADRAMQALMQATNGQNVDRKMTVHPQTLAAFVREQLEKGKPIPLDTLGAYVTVVAKIKKAKKEKK